MLTLATTSACAASSGESIPETAASTPAEVTSLSVDDATRDRARNAALDVRAQGCGPRVAFGSGSLIAEGVAVTAAHVVAGADEVWVIDPTGVEHTVEVVLFDPLLDIAVLRSDQLPGEPLTLRGPATAGERGVLALPRLDADDAWVVDEVDVTVVRTVNIDTTDIYLDTDVTRQGFEINGEIDPGDSGAVVVFADGAAGMVWARSTERPGRAWTVELPPAVTGADELAALTSPAALGPCLQ